MSGVDAEQPAKNAAEPEFTVIKEEMIFKRWVHSKFARLGCCAEAPPRK